MCNSYVGNLGDDFKEYLRIYFKDFTNEKNYTNNARYLNGIITYIISKKEENTQQRVPFWGSRTVCSTSGDNGCVVTSCTTTSYAFWMNTGSELTLSIDCSSLAP